MSVCVHRHNTPSETPGNIQLSYPQFHTAGGCPAFRRPSVHQSVRLPAPLLPLLPYYLLRLCKCRIYISTEVLFSDFCRKSSLLHHRFRLFLDVG